MKQILYFSLGAVSGGFLGYWLTKRHYESFIDDEIESVKEAFEEDKEVEKTKKVYTAKVRTLDYAMPEKEEEEDIDILEQAEVDETDLIDETPSERAEYPYTIGPDTYYEEHPIFDKETLTYYSTNDYLVTESDEVLDINDHIGRENLEKFGEYEENTLFVRNDKLGMDFEVVYVDGEYEPVD